MKRVLKEDRRVSRICKQDCVGGGIITCAKRFDSWILENIFLRF